MLRCRLPLGVVAAALVCAGVSRGEPSRDAPKVDVSNVPVEFILTEDTSGSRLGTFGLRLEEYGVTAYLHGYAMGGFALRSDRPATFQLGEFHVYAGAEIRRRVRPEVLVMLANAPEDGAGPLSFAPEIGYAQIDVSFLEDRLVARAGYFLVPIGSYNASSFPSYLHKLPRAPAMFGEVLPRHWAEVGLQLHGALDLGGGRSLRYAGYVVNGLEQADPDPADGYAPEGGEIGAMRRNLLDANHSDKGVGLRVQLDPVEYVSASASGYTGAYTVDGGRRLSIVDADVAARFGAFTLRAEGAIAIQEAATLLVKSGLYGYAAWRVHPIAEPVIGVDLVAGDADPRRTRLWFGSVLYPLPDVVPTLVAKAFGGLGWDAGGALFERELHLQVAVGF